MPTNIASVAMNWRELWMRKPIPELAAIISAATTVRNAPAIASRMPCSAK